MIAKIAQIFLISVVITISFQYLKIKILKKKDIKCFFLYTALLHFYIYFLS